MSEEWRNVPDSPYIVSNQGRIAKLMKQTARNGAKRGSYFHLNLKCRKGKFSGFVHRLVCEAFNGPSPGDGYEVAHMDGDSHNNNSTNLKWVTRKENQSHRLIHGTHNLGRRNGSAKLNENQVLEIRNRFHNGETCREIASRFEMNRDHIKRIVANKAWNHVVQQEQVK